VIEIGQTEGVSECVYLLRAAVLGARTKGDVVAGVPAASHGHGTAGNRYPVAAKTPTKIN